MITPANLQLYLILLSIVTGVLGVVALLIHLSQSSRPFVPKSTAKYARS